MKKFYEKNNVNVLEKLEQEEQNIKNQMAHNFLIIKIYEFNNELERGEKDDKHKGK